jgi:hypothetical protein
MQREDSFDSLITDDSPNGEGLAHSAALAGYYRTGKDLKTCFVAFRDFTVHIDRITYLKVRDFGF